MYVVVSYDDDYDERDDTFPRHQERSRPFCWAQDILLIRWHLPLLLHHIFFFTSILYKILSKNNNQKF